MNELIFKPLSFRRASDYIQDRIRKSILDGILVSGDRLPTEKEMAQKFGVSVVTLREALRGLENLGLIKKKKGQKGGIFVSAIDNDAIKVSIGCFLSFTELSAEQLYEVRKIIEPAMIKFSIRNISPDQIRILEENVSFVEEKHKNMGDSLSEQDFFDIDMRNNEFHRLIAKSTRNPILYLTVDYIMDFIPECETKYLMLDVKFSLLNTKEHRDILEAIKRHDEKQCRISMTHHLERLASYIANMKNTDLLK
ncbi:MAG: FCD domain-containing protein [Parachlamydia sp.]|nr:FCD domain-containing protein [Parachlamydia sp.]